MTKTTTQIEAELFAVLEDMKRDLRCRYRYEPRFKSILTEMRIAGLEVTDRLLDLELRLTEEAVEAQFDNMPV
mgnify:CR=1 FL=1